MICHGRSTPFTLYTEGTVLEINIMLISVAFINYFNVKNTCKVSVSRIKSNTLLSNYRNFKPQRHLILAKF